MKQNTIDIITSLTSNQSLNALPGWCSTEKALRMAEIVMREKPCSIVELGLFGARSFVPMCLALLELSEDQKTRHFAVGIDPWSHAACIEGMDPHDANDQKNIEYWSKVPLHDMQRRAVNAMENYKLWPVGAFLQARAELVVHLFANGSIDLLHVDDNHHTALRTIELWLPKCRAGAVVIFDDTNWPETQAGLALLGTLATLEADHLDHRIYRKN